jgi:UDP-N-acetylglucosamine 2-epimerase (non-hydrolysing)/UDP-GlcNAc3NAcA epimerase
MHRSKGKIVLVVGARPQFVKAAVLARRLRREDAPPLELVLVHTGQHYDVNMSDVFFRQLALPDPARHLEVGSAEAPIQAGMILKRLTPVLREEAPDAVMVVGDTNSTLAAALCAAQLELPVVHVEAGERIYRRGQVPEEGNRVVTDHLARLCLASTRHSLANLAAEGIGPARARFTGDPLFDLYRWAVARPEMRETSASALGLEPGRFILATIHRAENTDDPARLTALLATLDRASLPVALPLHPRTRACLAKGGFRPTGSLRIVEPLGYFDLIGLLGECRRCVTDSGGVIREAYFARRPSIVPMHGAYWPDILRAGWSLVVGHDLERLAEAIETFEPPPTCVEGIFGDGDAAGAIWREVAAMLDGPLDETPWAPIS